MRWDESRTNFDRNLAVIIGIDRYENDLIHDLSTPVSDARALANLLETEYEYKTENVRCLVNEQATLTGLRTLLTDALPNQLKPTTSDRLIFYFAGHGLPKNSDEGPTGYLVPQDAKLGREDSFLPMGEVYEALNKLRCHHLLVILDCCFAGTFRWARSRKLIAELETISREHYDRFIRHPAWQVITSSAHDQEALDFVKLSEDRRGQVNNEKHSPFALALLEALQDGAPDLQGKRYKNADYTKDGVVAAHELIVYLSNRVSQLSKERQAPGLYLLKREYDKGEFIFVEPGFDPQQLLPAPKLNEENNPYRGLKPFEERHAQFFFGRQKLVEELSDRLIKSRCPLTVVLGVSGSGKSSLVKAGLLPHLREKQEKGQQVHRWYILDPMRPGKSPFVGLARAVLPIAYCNLIDRLARVNFLDKRFAEILDPNSEQKQKATSPDQSHPDSRRQSSGDKSLDPTKLKLAQRWHTATPEAELLLVVDYFKQLKGFCHQSQEQAELSSLYGEINNTLKQLAQTLQQKPESFNDLIATWSRANPNTKLLLVIDQFEELMTMSQDERGSREQSDSQEQDKQREWQRFLSLLRIALAKYRRQLHVVLTLRSDFEPRFLNSALKAHWKNARFPVRAMYPNELQDAIEEPALKQALYFEPPKLLVGKLIAEVGQMPGALPLLSFTLSELYVKLYERWKPGSTDRALRIEDYEELGGVAGALTRRATEEYEALNEKHRVTMRRVMLRMVTIEGGGVARRRVPESELVYPSAQENKRRVLVIDCLVKARLLVKGQEIGEPYVEPAHDFLVRGWDKLQEWKDKEQENLVLQQRLTPAANDWYKATQAAKNGNKDEQVIGLLWNDDPRLEQLKEVLKSETNNWLNQLEKKFFEESVQRQQFELEETKRQRDEAIQGQVGALASLSQVRMSTNDQLGALVASLKAGVQLKGAPWLQDKLGTQVFNALQQAVYAVQERNRLEGNVDPIYRVSFSCDGQTIATANSDKTVKLWSTDGTLLKTFKGHTDEVIAVAFSPDGSMLASGSRDKTAKIWTIKDGTLLATFQQHETSICSVSFSRDSKMLASASEDGTVNLWNVVDNNLIQTLQSYNNAQVCFSPDGKTIASGGWDQPPWQGKIKVWNLDGTLLNTFKVGTGVLRGIDFSSDGKTIACTGDTGVVQLWQVTDGQLIVNIEAHKGGVWAMDTSISPDGSTIASVSTDRTIKLWSVDGRLLKALLGHTDAVYGVAFSPNSKILATASADKTIRLWSVDGPFLKSLDGQPGNAHFCVRFSPDGKMLASGSWDVQERGWTVKLWSVDGELLEIFTGHSDSVQTISFSSDSSLIASASWDGTVGIWTSDGELLKDFDKHGYAVNNASFSLSGKVLATVGGYHPSIRLWDLDSGELLKDITGHRDQVYRVLFSPDGTTFATASWDRTVKIWSINGDLLKTLSGHSNWLYGLSFSPDGKFLVSGGLDRTLKIWNAEGELLRTFTAHEDGIRDVVFSPDGKLIASASLDKTVKLWSVDGTLLKTISGHTAGVYGVSFSNDGQTIASASWDGSIKLWSTEALDFDGLLDCSRSWLQDYLKTNPNTLEERHLHDSQ